MKAKQVVEKSTIDIEFTANGSLVANVSDGTYKVLKMNYFQINFGIIIFQIIGQGQRI